MFFVRLKMIYYSNESISYLSWFWRLHDGWLFGLLASLPSLSWWLWWFCCCLRRRNYWLKIKQSFCRKGFSKIILLQEWSEIQSVLILWAVCHFGSYKNMPYPPLPPRCNLPFFGRNILKYFVIVALTTKEFFTTHRWPRTQRNNRNVCLFCNNFFWQKILRYMANN